MKETETVLRSWKLRKPSASIEQELFGLEQPCEKNERHAPLAFRWLVPATAGLLLLCLMINPRGSPQSGPEANRPMVAEILSNQSAIAYLPGSFKGDQNNVPADTFEWTNVSASTSSIRSLSGPRGTN